MTGERLLLHCNTSIATVGSVAQSIASYCNTPKPLEELYGLALLQNGDFIYPPPDMKLHKIASKGWRKGSANKKAPAEQDNAHVFSNHRTSGTTALIQSQSPQTTTSLGTEESSSTANRRAASNLDTLHGPTLHYRLVFYHRGVEEVRGAEGRWQLYLQLRQDMLGGRMHAASTQQLLYMAALALCVEMPDWRQLYEVCSVVCKISVTI